MTTLRDDTPIYCRSHSPIFFRFFADIIVIDMPQVSDFSAMMMWHGPGTKYNKPEARKYTLCIKKSSENAFLSEHGIKALADHEIGTHFVSFIAIFQLYDLGCIIISL